MMLKPDTPDTEEGWEALAMRIIRANLQLAGMTKADLSDRMRLFGIHQSEDAIRLKLQRKGFSAAFFLQALCAIGVEELVLPRTRRGGREITFGDVDGGTT